MVGSVGSRSGHEIERPRAFEFLKEKQLCKDMKPEKGCRLTDTLRGVHVRGSTRTDDAPCHLSELVAAAAPYGAQAPHSDLSCITTHLGAH